MALPRCSTCRGDRFVFASPEDSWQAGRACDECMVPCPKCGSRKGLRLARPFPFVIACSDCADEGYEAQGVDLHSVSAAADEWAVAVRDWLADRAEDAAWDARICLECEELIGSRPWVHAEVRGREGYAHVACDPAQEREYLASVFVAGRDA